MILMKALLVLFASSCGYLIAAQLVDKKLALLGLASGLIIALLALIFEKRVKQAPIRVVIGGAIGLIAGLTVANLLTYPLIFNFLNNRNLELAVYIFTNCLIGYLGLSIGMKKGEELTIFGGTKAGDAPAEPQRHHSDIKILDTSVIIDGRIADICDTGFIRGAVMIPQFVLGELQHIADSPDPLRKTKGRRGLDVIHKLQNHDDVEVVITDKDFPKIKEVDARLVALARDVGGRLLTNDANLIKVAELQGVLVLSINQLAKALKPLVLPGETMTIPIVKEGKEQGQGVGYLEDGTMVVVDNGRKRVGKATAIVITSVIDTTGGRMVFARPKEEAKDKMPHAS
ncbi:MAG: PIN/TRAM domain-containing protein [Thermodesulfobacteriota bacterium]